jgi:protocatechuate 3,4-dioxygenase, beta subunit
MRWIALLLVVANAALAQTHRMPSMRTPSGGSDICAKCEVPAHLTSSAILTPPGEPGQPMEISGTVYRADGHTPASGITIFVWHTDATGHYSPQDDPFAPRLRGWMRTGSDGRYSFRSIRPAPYPNHSEPAHIHVHVWSDTMPEHFLPEYWFSGDPLIKPEDRARFANLGTFSPVVTLTRGPDGVWRGVRNIRLEK